MTALDDDNSPIPGASPFWIAYSGDNRSDRSQPVHGLITSLFLPGTQEQQHIPKLFLCQSTLKSGHRGAFTTGQ